jgi:hypothetical protein
MAVNLTDDLLFWQEQARTNPEDYGDGPAFTDDIKDVEVLREMGVDAYYVDTSKPVEPSGTFSVIKKSDITVSKPDPLYALTPKAETLVPELEDASKSETELQGLQNSALELKAQMQQQLDAQLRPVQMQVDKLAEAYQMQVERVSGYLRSRLPIPKEMQQQLDMAYASYKQAADILEMRQKNLLATSPQLQQLQRQQEGVLAAIAQAEKRVDTEARLQTSIRKSEHSYSLRKELIKEAGEAGKDLSAKAAEWDRRLKAREELEIRREERRAAARKKDEERKMAGKAAEAERKLNERLEAEDREYKNWLQRQKDAIRLDLEALPEELSIRYKFILDKMEAQEQIQIDREQRAAERYDERQEQAEALRRARKLRNEAGKLRMLYTKTGLRMLTAKQKKEIRLKEREAARIEKELAEGNKVMQKMLDEVSAKRAAAEISQPGINDAYSAYTGRDLGADLHQKTVDQGAIDFLG